MSDSDADVHRKAAQLAAAGDYGAASELLSALGDRQRGDLDPSHPALGRTLGELALIAFAQGKHQKARPLVESTIDILRKSLGPLNPTLSHRMREFAQAAQAAGDAAFAETLRQRVAQIPALPVENAIIPLDADALEGFGSGFAARGEFEEAERHLREAIRIWRTSPASRWDLAAALSGLGEVLRRTGSGSRRSRTPCWRASHPSFRTSNGSDSLRTYPRISPRFWRSSGATSPARRRASARPSGTC